MAEDDLDFSDRFIDEEDEAVDRVGDEDPDQHDGWEKYPDPSLDLSVMGGSEDVSITLYEDVPPPLPIQLAPEQQHAIDLARTQPFTYISGTAGVGKTYVAKLIKQQLEGVELAATTGIASVNLGEGTTIHALLGFFDLDSLRQKYTDGHIHAKLRSLRRAGLRRIILDEVSMLSADALTMIVRAIAEVNASASLAGVGEDDDEHTAELRERDTHAEIGLTLVGDFGQLPPVPDEDPKTGKKLPVRFAFESPEWSRFAPHTTTLTQIFRQDAQDFVGALHAIRRGDLAKATAFFTPEKFELQTDDSFEGSTIFAKNDAVDRHNQLRLDAITGAEMASRRHDWGKPRGDWKQIPQVLTLKEHALVMILANRRDYEDDADRGTIVYANGDLGELLGMNTRGEWLVKLQRNGVTYTVNPVTRHNTIPLEPGRKKELKAQYGIDPLTGQPPYVTDDGKYEIVGTVQYMPLRCAYGCTVHKTQGLSLDKVQINLRDPFFRHPGMLFVALSRARTAEGLRIVGNQRGFIERCTVEPRVRQWL